MKVIQTPQEMNNCSEKIRRQGKRIAFVPTMGYLHDGHLSLMSEGRKKADILIVSIFVNPTQFGPQEDLEAYPRDFEKDEKLMQEAGVDVVFYPQADTIYPEGYQTYITVEKVSQNLCGISRPFHFQGVATVVAKLFNIVNPHLALFGKKDFQQLILIKRMVKDLNFNIEIIGCPTFRETDGLAMSSRNSYLSAEERQTALNIKKSIDSVCDLFQNGERNTKTLLKKAEEILSEQPLIRIDYLKICDIETLEDIKIIEKESVLAIAAFVGKTRLIDNFVFLEEVSQ